MKECEEENMAVVTPINNDEKLLMGRCCLISNVITVKTSGLLNRENLIDTVEKAMRLKKEIKGMDFSLYRACNGKERCSLENFKIDTIKINNNCCNLKCTMCRPDSKLPEAPNSKELYFTLLEKVKGHKLQTLVLTTTGEPFFFKEETLQYLEGLTTDDFQGVVIVTNGTLINEEDVKRISELKIKTYFTVSIDAITKETYDKIRLGGNFEKAVETVRLLKKYNITVKVNFVIQHSNMHEVELVEDFWDKIGVKVNFIYDRGCEKDSRRTVAAIQELKKDHPKFFEAHKGKIE